MISSKKRSVSDTAGSVIAIRPQADAIEPMPGWEREGVLGHMAFDGNATGRLVRLADIVRWLMASRGLPRGPAVEVLCNGLVSGAMEWMYLIQKADFAKPVPLDSMFGGQTAEEIEKAKAQYAQDRRQQLFEQERSEFGRFQESLAAALMKPTWSEPVDPGVPALARALRRNWAKSGPQRGTGIDPMDDPRFLYSLLAVPLVKAHATWGWGVVSVASQVQQSPGPNDWTAERLEELRREVASFDKQNGRGGRAEAARRYNVRPSRITELLGSSKAGASAMHWTTSRSTGGNRTK